jgi:hypothetical protein
MTITNVLRKLITNPRSALSGLARLAALLPLAARNRLSSAAVIQPEGPVISMTSYGSRLQTVYLALESIARGSCRPSRVILWVDNSDLYENPPKPIRRLQRRGLEVRLCENLGPHKKYYPYLHIQSEFKDPLITADDDIIYPRWWLSRLMEAYRKSPRQVHCYRAHVIETDEEGLKPYRDWKPCTTTEPSYCNFATGVSGILYPPELQRAIKEAGDEFRQCCPKADDLWLHVQAIRAGYMIHQVYPKAIHFPVLPGTQANSLFQANVLEGDGNDLQAKETYSDSDLEKLREERSVYGPA